MQAFDDRNLRLRGLPREARELIDRQPFAYEHELSNLDLFGIDRLAALAARYDRDYFVADGADTPGTRFYSVGYGTQSPSAALEQLERTNRRILLKSPENYDERYRELLLALFSDVMQIRGGLRRGERVVRLASSVLISSAATITPFHFDPEVSFFFQIAGDKEYHLYSPESLSERELESFYWMGIVNVGQVDLRSRDPRHRYIFRLRPGLGMHQPQNSPHWVRTGSSRTISYVFSFETNFSRALGRTRAFNHYARSIGLTPSEPGCRPLFDSAKAEVMRLAIPMRKGVARAIRRANRDP